MLQMRARYLKQGYIEEGLLEACFSGVVAVSFIVSNCALP